MKFLRIIALKNMVRKIKDVDHAFECAGIIDDLKRAIAEADEKWQKAMLKYIKKHGPIEMKFGMDTIRYYAGHQKDTKCTDRNVAFRLIYKKVGIRRVREALSSQPFKSGHCKAVLKPNAFKQCFKTTTRKKLDADGNPEEILKTRDSRFT